MSAHGPAPDPSVIRPRLLWFWVGGLIVVLGIGGGIAAFVIGLYTALSGGQFAGEFRSGESLTFEAEHANTDAEQWQLYADLPVGSRYAVENCTVTGPDGEVEMLTPGYTSQFTSNGRTWELVALIIVTEPGSHTAECAPGSDAVFAPSYAPSGASMVQGILGGVGLFVVLPMVGILVGGTVLVVTGVRRSTHRRRLREEAGYGPGGYGYGPGPGPGSGPGAGPPYPPYPPGGPYGPP